jgi:hypothetical protein
MVRTHGGSVSPSFREILAESHIAAVSIVVLLVWSLTLGLQALWSPLWRAASFISTAVAILDIPSYTFPRSDQVILLQTFTYLFTAFIYLAAAWVLSRWVYGLGPLRSLSKFRTRLARRNNVRALEAGDG